MLNTRNKKQIFSRKTTQKVNLIPFGDLSEAVLVTHTGGVFLFPSLLRRAGWINSLSVIKNQPPRGRDGVES